MQRCVWVERGLMALRWHKVIGIKIPNYQIITIVNICIHWIKLEWRFLYIKWHKSLSLFYTFVTKCFDFLQRIYFQGYNLFK